MAAKINRLRSFASRHAAAAVGLCALLGLMVLAALPARGQSTPAQRSTPPAQPGAQQPASGSAAPATDAHAPAKPDAGAAPAQPATQPPAEAAASGTRPAYAGMTPEEKRKQEVALECADILKLATDLKAQVDKTSKDELSVSVVRKATELEQVAHKVRNGLPVSASGQQARGN